jgi:hypothetical protein
VSQLFAAGFDVQQIEFDSRQLYPTFLCKKRGIENILKAEISELEKRKNKLQLSYNESKISVKSRLISLNYIYVYG